MFLAMSSIWAIIVLSRVKAEGMGFEPISP